MKTAMFSLIDDLEDHIPEFRKKLQLLKNEELTSEALVMLADIHGRQEQFNDYLAGILFCQVPSDEIPF